MHFKVLLYNMEKRIEDIKGHSGDDGKSPSKFCSLNYGLSGVLAGITAIVGAAFAYFYLLRQPVSTDFNRYQNY